MSIHERLRQCRVVAVLRAPDPSSALECVHALVDAGVTGIEITYSTPDAAQVIARLAEEYGRDIVLVAGTVVEPRQVAEAAAAGAELLVSPGSTPVLLDALRQAPVPFAVGALTPSEVMAAAESGAAVVKLFPGSLGGPGYLRALRGPFPDVPIMPTGGVSAANAADWLAAGALCVGAGSELVPTAALAAGDWDGIRRSAAAFMDVVGSRP